MYLYIFSFLIFEIIICHIIYNIFFVILINLKESPPKKRKRTTKKKDETRDNEVRSFIII